MTTGFQKDLSTSFCRWRTDSWRSQRAFRLSDYPASPWFAQILLYQAISIFQVSSQLLFPSLQLNKINLKEREGRQYLDRKIQALTSVAFVQVTTGMNYYNTHCRAEMRQRGKGRQAVTTGESRRDTLYQKLPSIPTPPLVWLRELNVSERGFKTLTVRSDRSERVLQVSQKG